MDRRRGGLDRLSHVKVGSVGGVRDGWDVRRRMPADVFERDAVEIGVSLKFVGASPPKPLSLVAQ